MIEIFIAMRRCKLIASDFKNVLLTRFRRIICGRKPGGNRGVPDPNPHTASSSSL